MEMKSQVFEGGNLLNTHHTRTIRRPAWCLVPPTDEGDPIAATTAPISVICRFEAHKAKTQWKLEASVLVNDSTNV